MPLKPFGMKNRLTCDIRFMQNETLKPLRKRKWCFAAGDEVECGQVKQKLGVVVAW